MAIRQIASKRLKHSYLHSIYEHFEIYQLAFATITSRNNISTMVLCLAHHIENKISLNINRALMFIFKWNDWLITTKREKHQHLKKAEWQCLLRYFSIEDLECISTTHSIIKIESSSRTIEANIILEVWHLSLCLKVAWNLNIKTI